MPGGRIRPVSKVSQPASVERPAGKLKSLCGFGPRECHQQPAVAALWRDLIPEAGAP